MKKLFILVFVLSSSFLFSKQHIVLTGRDAGMFSVMMDVLHECNLYERRRTLGLTVDFGTGGLYYSESHGPNWWNYYCEPICVGKIERKRFIDGRGSYFFETHTTRKEANEIFRKYVHIKKEIRLEVDQFVKNHFKDKYVITVHYRGTDKAGDRHEAPRISYEEACDAICQKIEDLGDQEYVIFLATDETDMLEYLTCVFGDKICYQNAMRTSGGTGLHCSNIDRYQHGKEALIDMLLLSKGNCLIRTSSNLSLVSTWVNPDMEVIDLTTRNPVF